MAKSPTHKKTIYLMIAVAIIISVVIFYPTKKKELRFSDIVISPDINSSIPSGTPLAIKLNQETLQDKDSIIIKFGETYMTMKDDFNYSIATTTLPLGYHAVDISVFDDKKSKTVALPFFITSDIKPTNSSFTSLSRISHDKKSYTQGFEFYNGILYESTGQYKESTIRKINPKNGQNIKTVSIGGEFFGEGLTILKGKVYQITWKESTCFVYDDQLNLIKKTGFRTTTGEGWGLCNDGTSLIVSDGSNKLTFLNPETFAVEKIMSVYAGANEMQNLNELEYVDGYIYANIYTTNQIVKIDAKSSKVVSVFDFTSLKNQNQDGEVLNGIAFNPSSKSFFITGKYWGNMYEVKL